MAEVSFRISVVGAEEAAEDVQKVKDALTGVEAGLDKGTAASGSFEQATTQLSTAEKETAVTGEVAAQSLETLGATVKETGAAHQSTAKTSSELWQELLESTKHSTELGDALTTELNPALAETDEKSVKSGVATQFAGVALQGATAAVTLAAAAIGVYLALLSKVVDAQTDVAVARKNQDFNALTSGLSKAIDGYEKYTATLEIAYDANETLGKRVAAATTAIYGFFTGAAVSTDVIIQWAKGIDQGWQAIGRLADAQKVAKAEIEATAAALEVAKASATSTDDLARISEVEAENARRRAQIAADEITLSREVAAQKLASAAAIADSDGQHELAARLYAQEAEARANTAKLAAAELAQGESNAATVKISASKAVGEARARELEDLAKLAQIQGDAASQAVQAAQAELDARQKVVAADAGFFATQVTNLTAYQSQRRLLIEQQAALELQTLDRVYQADRAAQLARIAALPAGSLAQQAELAKLEQMDAAHHAKRQELAAGTSQKLRDDEARATEERRANYARNITLLEDTYKHEQALGQENAVARLELLRKYAADENLSRADQRKFAEEYFAEQLRMFTQTNALMAALGKTNEVDAVNSAARVAASYQEGSEKRIKAETEWANAVKKLRDEVATTGNKAIDAAIAALKEEGANEFGFAEIAAKMTDLAAKATATGQELAAGGRATEEAWTNVKTQSALAAEAMRLGVDPTQAMLVATTQMLNPLLGIRDTTATTADQMQRLGINVSTVNGSVAAITPAFESVTQASQGMAFQVERDADGNIVAIRNVTEAYDAQKKAIDNVGNESSQTSGGIEGQLGRIGDAATGVTEKFNAIGVALGSSLQTGTSAALDTVLGQFDDFFVKLDEKLNSGLSTYGDNIYNGFITRVMQRLDDEAARS